MAVKPAAPLNRIPLPSEEGAAPQALGDLIALAGSLAAWWDRLAEDPRHALIRQIQHLATELASQARPDSDARAGGEGSPAVTGFIFLTARELEVLRALAEGLSTSRIASLLGVAPATVRSHVKSLLSKLGVHSRVEAVSRLLRHDAAFNGAERRSLNMSDVGIVDG